MRKVHMCVRAFVRAYTYMHYKGPDSKYELGERYERIYTRLNSGHQGLTNGFLGEVSERKRI